MAAARRLLKASSEGQSKVSLLTASLVRECCRKFAKGDLSGDELLAAFAASEKLGQGKASELMAQFIDAWRSEFMAAKRLPDPVRAPFELGRSIGRGSQFLKEFGELDRGDLGFNLQAEQLISVWAAKAGNSTLRAGRETMELSTIRARTRFRRIAHANACAFCAMLATRSDYYSAESALYVVGRQASGKRGFRLNRDSGLWGQAPVRYTGKTRGANRPIGSKYHDNCNCTVAEVTGDPEVDGIGDHGYGKLYSEAFDALDKAGKRRTLPEIMAEMRRRGQGVIRDAHVPENQKRKPGPKTKTGGSGGGKKFSRKTGDAAGGFYRDVDGNELNFGPSDVRGFEDCMEHILNGDLRRGKETGGHLHEVVAEKMVEGKIAFPKEWGSEAVKLAVRQTIDVPDRVVYRTPSMVNLEKDIDKVLVCVQLVLKKRSVVVRTAFPIKGLGVVRVHNGKLVPVE